MQSPSHKKIAIIVTTPMIVRFFLVHQINTLAQLYSVTLICNIDGNRTLLDDLSSDVSIHSIPIRRKIHLFDDIKVLWLLWKFFRFNKFDLIHSVSPKAGLLSSMAGRLAGIPCRVHTFTGQVWVTKSGIMRFILKFLDTLVVRFTTSIIVDSSSQRNFLIKQNILHDNNSTVLMKGSISGVDLGRFCPNSKHRSDIRKRLKIGKASFVLIYVGRLKQEKGVVELTQAFLQLRKNQKNVKLMIVGPDEENMQERLVDSLKKDMEHVHFIPFTNTPEKYMAAADIFVLPSHREGFGTVIIEAAACGLPSVASNIYGLSDAVSDGVSGFLVEVGDINALSAAIEKLVADRGLFHYCAEQAIERAHSDFSHQCLTNALVEHYRGLLADNNE